MSYIESAKSYTGSELESIFFRPLVSAESANDLGIRVLYNMPIPTNVHLWSRGADILHKFTKSGWVGSDATERTQKTIPMSRVKAEMAFSASDYFSMVLENIVASSGVNFEDLTGTELEKAETELFKRALNESIRATMWLGDTERATGFNTFDGLLKPIFKGVEDCDVASLSILPGTISNAEVLRGLIDTLWSDSSHRLRSLKGEGQLVLFVTTDIYESYECMLDQAGVDSSYIDSINGRPALLYHGIPMVNVQLDDYIEQLDDVPSTFMILTDRRNLVMALNTSELPGAEVRMWYNPDEMENRQRATFMAGCDFLDPELVSVAYLGV